MATFTLVLVATLLAAALIGVPLLITVYYIWSRFRLVVGEKSGGVGEARGYMNYVNQFYRAAQRLVIVGATSIAALVSAIGLELYTNWPRYAALGILTGAAYSTSLYQDQSFAAANTLYEDVYLPIMNDLIIPIVNAFRLFYDLLAPGILALRQTLRIPISTGILLVECEIEVSSPRYWSTWVGLVVNIPATAALETVRWTERIFEAPNSVEAADFNLFAVVNATQTAVGYLLTPADASAFSCICSDLDPFWDFTRNLIENENAARSLDRGLNAVIQAVRTVIGTVARIFTVIIPGVGKVAVDTAGAAPSPAEMLAQMRAQAAAAAVPLTLRVVMPDDPGYEGDDRSLREDATVYSEDATEYTDFSGYDDDDYYHVMDDYERAAALLRVERAGNFSLPRRLSPRLSGGTAKRSGRLPSGGSVGDAVNRPPIVAKACPNSKPLCPESVFGVPTPLPDFNPAFDRAIDAVVLAGEFADDVLQLVYDALVAEIQSLPPRPVPRIFCIGAQIAAYMGRYLQVIIDLIIHVVQVFDPCCNYALNTADIDAIFFQQARVAQCVYEAFVAFGTDVDQPWIGYVGGAISSALEARLFYDQFVTELVVSIFPGVEYEIYDAIKDGIVETPVPLTLLRNYNYGPYLDAVNATLGNTTAAVGSINPFLGYAAGNASAAGMTLTTIGIELVSHVTDVFTNFSFVENQPWTLIEFQLEIAADNLALFFYQFANLPNDEQCEERATGSDQTSVLFPQWPCCVGSISSGLVRVFTSYYTIIYRLLLDFICIIDATINEAFIEDDKSTCCCSYVGGDTDKCGPDEQPFFPEGCCLLKDTTASACRIPRLPANCCPGRVPVCAPGQAASKSCCAASLPTCCDISDDDDDDQSGCVVPQSPDNCCDQTFPSRSNRACDPMGPPCDSLGNAADKLLTDLADLLENNVRAPWLLITRGIGCFLGAPFADIQCHNPGDKRATWGTTTEELFLDLSGSFLGVVWLFEDITYFARTGEPPKPSRPIIDVCPALSGGEASIVEIVVIIVNDLLTPFAELLDSLALVLDCAVGGAILPVESIVPGGPANFPEYGRGGQDVPTSDTKLEFDSDGEAFPRETTTTEGTTLRGVGAQRQDLFDKTDNARAGDIVRSIASILRDIVDVWVGEIVAFITTFINLIADVFNGFTWKRLGSDIWLILDCVGGLLFSFIKNILLHNLNLDTLFKEFRNFWNGTLGFIRSLQCELIGFVCDMCEATIHVPIIDVSLPIGEAICFGQDPDFCTEADKKGFNSLGCKVSRELNENADVETKLMDALRASLTQEGLMPVDAHEADGLCRAVFTHQRAFEAANLTTVGQAAAYHCLMLRGFATGLNTFNPWADEALVPLDFFSNPARWINAVNDGLLAIVSYREWAETRMSAYMGAVQASLDASGRRVLPLWTAEDDEDDMAYELRTDVQLGLFGDAGDGSDPDAWMHASTMPPLNGRVLREILRRADAEIIDHLEADGVRSRLVARLTTFVHRLWISVAAQAYEVNADVHARRPARKRAARSINLQTREFAGLNATAAHPALHPRTRIRRSPLPGRGSATVDELRPGYASRVDAMVNEYKRRRAVTWDAYHASRSDYLHSESTERSGEPRVVPDWMADANIDPTKLASAMDAFSITARLTIKTVGILAKNNPVAAAVSSITAIRARMQDPAPLFPRRAHTSFSPADALTDMTANATAALVRGVAHSRAAWWGHIPGVGGAPNVSLPAPRNDSRVSVALPAAHLANATLTRLSAHVEAHARAQRRALRSVADHSTSSSEPSGETTEGTTPFLPELPEITDDDNDCLGIDEDCCPGCIWLADVGFPIIDLWCAWVTNLGNVSALVLSNPNSAIEAARNRPPIENQGFPLTGAAPGTTPPRPSLTPFTEEFSFTAWVLEGFGAALQFVLRLGCRIIPLFSDASCDAINIDIPDFIDSVVGFFVNTNTDPDAGPVGLLAYLEAAIECDVDALVRCNRGLSLVESIGLVSLIAAGIYAVAVLISPAVLGRAVIPLLVIGVPIAILSVNYGVSPICYTPLPFPSTPQCVVDEFQLILEDISPDDFPWNDLFPGIRRADGSFVNCASEFGFVDFADTSFYLLQRDAPGVNDWLRTTSFVLVSWIRDSPWPGDGLRRYTFTGDPPAVLDSCANISLLSYAPLLLVSLLVSVGFIVLVNAGLIVIGSLFVAFISIWYFFALIAQRLSGTAAPADSALIDPDGQEEWIPGYSSARVRTVTTPAAETSTGSAGLRRRHVVLPASAVYLSHKKAE